MEDEVVAKPLFKGRAFEISEIVLITAANK